MKKALLLVSACLRHLVANDQNYDQFANQQTKVYCMKFLSVLACTLLMCACSSKEVKSPADLMLEDALNQMDATIKGVVADPNPVIEYVENVFVSDSVVILHCIIRAHNAFGGYAKQQTEYVYGICEDGTLKENLENMNDIMNTHVIFSNELGNSIKALTGDAMPKFSNAQDSVRYIKDKALESIGEYGREVKVNDTSNTSK